MTKFGTGINKLEFYLFQSVAACLREEATTERDHATHGARDGPFEDDVVLFDNAVVGKASHGSNTLFRYVIVRRSLV